ncbi:MAG: hypothetical protein IKU17_00600 [Clostridia bacterium]|nr:hypothetical protein [Clostridia bacterium]
MTNKDLRHLRRSDLLELLLKQSREMEELQAKMQMMQEQLGSRSIAVNKAGSIAEASLQLNSVFEAAQNAADQYLENIKTYAEQQDETFKRLDAARAARFEQMTRDMDAKYTAEEEERRTRCEAMEAETRAHCEEMEAEARRRCEAMVKQAEAESKEYWEKVSKQLEKFYDAHVGMRELLLKTLPGSMQK